MSESLLQQHGAQSNKPPKYVPILVDRFFSGYYPNRNPLRDPSDLATSRFYGGKPDSLWDGSNIELTNQLTLQRRPGLVSFSTAVYPTAPDRAFSFELIDGTIQVIIDTGSTGNLSVTESYPSGAGPGVYYGTFPLGGSDAYVGMLFSISGFVHPGNNGSNLLCIASTTTSITLINPTATHESTAAIAVSAGAVYYDQQNGLKTFLFGKSAGAGRSTFVGVSGVMFVGDGVDTWKYTPLNTNGTVWNWGIFAPTQAPTVKITESGVASVSWVANTVWSTMGLIYDTATHSTQQLISVNASTTNLTQFGITGNGQPTWNQAPGGTTTESTGSPITWTNYGPVVAWTANTTYNNASIGGTAADPCVVYDLTTKSCYININPGFTNGISGASRPAFVTGNGAITNDGTVKWLYIGTPGTPQPWIASTSYPKWGSQTNYAACSVVEPIGLENGLPTTQTVYLQVSGGGTSGSGGTSPTWSSVPGTQATDGDLIWESLGSDTWAATTLYSGWFVGGTLFSAIFDGTNFQVCTTTGISGTIVPGTSATLTAATANSPVAGQTTYTGTFATPFLTGVGNLPAVITGFVNGGNNGTFTIISSTTSQLVVSNRNGVNESHSGTAVYNPWGTTYSSTTVDGTAVWTCVGAGTTWVASTKWYLPSNGFFPPSGSNPYGGASVIDSNSNVEFVISSGKGGSTAPSWNPIGSNTTDSAATWYNLEAFSSKSLTWQTGYVYAYSFKARSLTDYYSVPVLGGNPASPNATTLPIPPGYPTALPTPTGSETDVISTASPVYTITGGNEGAVNTISGYGSTDPQVDTIVIWRSADGGGSANMFELTEIPAPQPKNGIAQPWTFQDYFPDVPSTINGIVYPGLDNLIPAPIDGENNPPPSGFLPMVYNFGKIWGADGSTVNWSGGPDVVTGNPNEAFNASDEFQFLAGVTRIVKSASQGVLILFLTDSIEGIFGGPSTSSLYPAQIANQIGLVSYDALDTHGAEIYFFASDGSFCALTPSLGVQEAGFAIENKIVTWNPANVYVTFHKNGIDNCAMLADGANGWYRENPFQIPGGASGPDVVWSPFANITNGCQMVQSVEVSPGIRKLLVGPTTGGGSILQRDTTVFTDNGTMYDAWFTMGSLVLANPGQLAILKFIECDFSGVQYQPTVSYLLNEISGSFTSFVQSPIADPPSLYGNTTWPLSYSPNRYFLDSNGSLGRLRHMQLKVDFGLTSNPDTILGLTLFGRILVEN